MMHNGAIMLQKIGGVLSVRLSGARFVGSEAANRAPEGADTK